MDQQYHIIGEAAGKIYKTLEQHGEKTPSQLQKAAGVSDPAVFNQALGWLAREANISMSKQGRSVKVALAQVTA